MKEENNHDHDSPQERAPHKARRLPALPTIAWEANIPRDKGPGRPAGPDSELHIGEEPRCGSLFGKGWGGRCQAGGDVAQSLEKPHQPWMQDWTR